MLRKSETKILVELEKDALRAELDSIKLQKHPTNTVLAAKVQTDLAQLTTDASTNPVPVDAIQCSLGVNGNLVPIAAVAPQDGILQGHIATDESNSDNVGQQLQSPMTLALQIVSRIETSI
jgi:hypothetical protein